MRCVDKKGNTVPVNCHKEGCEGTVVSLGVVRLPIGMGSNSYEVILCQKCGNTEYLWEKVA